HSPQRRRRRLSRPSLQHHRVHAREPPHRPRHVHSPDHLLSPVPFDLHLHLRLPAPPLVGPRQPAQQHLLDLRLVAPTHPLQQPGDGSPPPAARRRSRPAASAPPAATPPAQGPGPPVAAAPAAPPPGAAGRRWPPPRPSPPRRRPAAAPRPGSPAATGLRLPRRSAGA